MAVPIAIERRNLAGALLGAAITFLLGAAFLALEVSEFSRMIAIGAGPTRSAFLSAFFTLVGTHGLHVTSGLLWLLVMMAQIATLGALRSALEEHRGDCPVVLHVDSGTSVDEISLALDFSVDPGPALERAVEILVGESSYWVEMHRVRAPQRERATARR